MSALRVGLPLVALLAAVASPAPPPARAENEPVSLSLVSTVWPPFTDVADRPRLASDLVAEALRRAGVAAETSIVPDGRLVPSMRDGTHDGSAALWRSADRESFLLYSKPYMENRLVLVGRKGADVGAGSLSELGGKRVAVVRGYAYGPAIAEATSTRFVIGDDIAQNVRRVLDDEADYLLIDELVIRHIVAGYGDVAEDRLEIGTRPLVKRSLHFALRRDRPEARAIVAGFDAAIPEMLADGTYNRILGMDWIDADVDGDGASELIFHGVRAGPTPPLQAYRIVVPDDAPPSADRSEAPRFLIGGELYDDWRQVPKRFREPLALDETDPDRVQPLFKIKF